MPIAAIVVWVLITLVAIALFIWWWRGVHSKSNEDQVAKTFVAHESKRRHLAVREGTEADIAVHATPTDDRQGLV